MYTRTIAVLLLALTLPLLAACSQAQPEATVGPPAALPSAAPEPTRRPTPKPTARPTSKPSAVPTPHLGADPSKNPVLLLQKAIDTTRTATIYRLDFTTDYTMPQPNATAASGVLRVVAEVEGQTMHTTYHDSRRPYDTYETIISGGTSYVHNPLAQAGMPDEWFMSLKILPVRREQLAPAALLDTFVGQKINLAEFAADASEQLDNQTCARYYSQGDAALRALNVLQDEVSSSDTQINEHLTRKEMRFWVCADGRVHQVLVGLEGDDGKKPANKVAYQMRLRLLDFGGSFHINPPSFALPLPPEAMQASPPATQQPAPAAALTATVFNGGNVREVPVSGRPLDQINAQETVELLGKTGDGAWYLIGNVRGATGWVSASLLTIDAATAARVPIAPATTRGTPPNDGAAQPGTPNTQITKLVSFTHGASGITGLRPEGWALSSLSSGFTATPHRDAPDTFVGVVITPNQYRGGVAAQSSREIISRLKTNQADGPAPQILEEQMSEDGNGLLLVTLTGLAADEQTPLRMTIYARTTATPAGLLVAFCGVPAAQYTAEAALVRQMVDSLKLGPREQF